MVKKMKKCKNCGERFEPRFNTLEKYCWNSQCKTIEALQKLDQFKKSQTKLDQAKVKRLKESLETASDVKKKVQKEFNTYIRLRDRMSPCISCGNKLGAKYDAGHFYSVGNYPALRFHEDNCHAQCVHCNQYNGGMVHEYKINLEVKIGSQRLQELHDLRNSVKKYSKPELLELLAEYKFKASQLKSGEK
jgi:hypothetical protein